MNRPYLCLITSQIDRSCLVAAIYGVNLGIGIIAALYDSIFDFWQCQSCNHLYSDGLDDPDYDDDVHQAQEAIADGQEVTWFLKSKVAVK